MTPIEQRVAAVYENLTDTNTVLVHAVEQAMYDRHDASSAIELAERVRRLQAEQNQWITEALGLMCAEAGVEQVAP